MNCYLPKWLKFFKKLIEKLRNFDLFTIINDCFKQTKDLHFFKNLHIHVSENSNAVPIIVTYS